MVGSTLRTLTCACALLIVSVQLAASEKVLAEEYPVVSLVEQVVHNPSIETRLRKELAIRQAVASDELSIIIESELDGEENASIQAISDSCHLDFKCWAIFDAIAILERFPQDYSQAERSTNIAAMIVRGSSAAVNIRNASESARASDENGSSLSAIEIQANKAAVFRNLTYYREEFAQHKDFDFQVFRIVLRGATRREDERNRLFLVENFSLDDVQPWPTTKRDRLHFFQFIHHADHAPDFQLRWLAAVKKGAHSGVYSRMNLALLEDRTFLKVFGFQPFGTQLVCNEGGGLSARGEKPPIPYDEAWAAHGLGSYDEYIARFAGFC